MKLQQLFSDPSIVQFFTPHGVTIQRAPPQLLEHEVNSITSDSRVCDEGSIFVAVQGTKFDSHQNLKDAVSAGVQIVVIENDFHLPTTFAGWVLKIPSTRAVVSKLAAALYDHPSKKMICFAVTGTNGKTSMTYLIEHLLHQQKQCVGVMGTVNHRVGDEYGPKNSWSTELTTPDPSTLQKRLSEFVDAGARYVAMEVSSHALDQDRAADVHFDVGIFTNLTHDHLDYHGSMENYFHSKQKLFTDLLRQSSKIPKFAVVNLDDRWGRKLRVADQVMIWTFGKTKEADFSYHISKTTIEGTEFQLNVRGESFVVKSPLIGEHNVSNVVAAVTATTCIGLPIQNAIKSIESFHGIPGRLQRVLGISKCVFVDYAHTPDALESTLKTVAALKGTHRLITVFGCGGDRDKSKRPLMAKASSLYSDEIFVTSDNPRTEDPMAIINDIEVGFGTKKNVHVVVDREHAILEAIKMSSNSDIIVIAGKGHEDYQIIGHEKKPFSDYEHAKKAAGGLS